MRWTLLFLLAGCVTPIGAEEHQAALDADRDGVTGPADCDDTNPDVHEGAVEWCNGIDDDCDGVIDGPDARAVRPWWPDGDGDGLGDLQAEATWACEAPEGMVGVDGDCDDGDAGVGGPAEYFLDGDGDGYGRPGTSQFGCATDPTLADNDEDCDDNDDMVSPAEAEQCDGKDTDCNGTVDDVPSPPEWFPDADGDGRGVPAGSVSQCDPPTGYVLWDDDCDDSDPDRFPGNPEICNGIDDDCANGPDDGLTLSSFYGDQDGDGFGGSELSVQACIAPPGWFAASDDCDDTDPAKFPSATERCNGLDDDCDGSPDASELDGDGDGVSSCAGDCNDADATVFPGAIETCNGVDDDCVGGPDDVAPDDLPRWYVDSDGDGHGDPALWLADCSGDATYSVAAGDDCDDSDALVSPTESEFCGDGIDNDCDRVGCGLSGAHAADVAGLALSGLASGDLLGATVAVGDLDGDDVPDLVIGAPGSDTGEGTVWWLPGPLASDADLQTDGYAITSVGVGAEGFGSGLLIADLDRDGVDDLVVGAGGHQNGAPDGGAAWVFHGPLTGGFDAATADASILCDVAGARLGDVMAVADLDDDSQPDLVFGAPAASGTGEVYGFHGPFAGALTMADVDVTLTPSGSTAAGAGLAVSDRDEDGKDDLWVASHGALYALDGPVATGDLDTVAAVVLDGTFDGVLRTADLDGDGRSEVVAGTDTTAAGTVHLVGPTRFLRSGPVEDAARASFVGSGVDSLGSAGLAVGDVDGDGVVDLALGGANLAWRFAGPHTGSVASGEAQLTISGTSPDDALGNALALVDLDGDGFDELVVGAPQFPGGTGTVYIFYGEGF